MPRHDGHTLQAATGVLVAAYVISTVVRADNTTIPFFDTWIGNLGYLGCAVLCLWRAVAQRRHRAAWAAIAASLFLFTGGSVLWTTTVQHFDPVPYPSVADLFFLVFYPVALIGVGLLVRDTMPGGSRAIWWDGLIAALGVAALEATFVIAPISHGNRGDAATVATNLAYPIGDLVLVMMIVAVFAVWGWRPGRPWWALGAGLIFFAVADSVYVLRVTSGTYVTGTPLDGLWLIGAFLIATAAWQRPCSRSVGRVDAAGSARASESDTARVVVPGLFLVSSLAIVVFGSWGGVLPLAQILAACTLLAAIGRLGYAYRQLQALAESRREARTDELTRLPNRRLFYETLQSRLEIASEARTAVLMIDLDRFKEINDSLGHAVGDEVLRQLGPRLTSVVGTTGTVARLGGDEFGLVISPLESVAQATAVAERICAVLQIPFQLDTISLRVDASIGIAIAPDHGTVADALLMKADVAMYESKRNGQPWEVYAACRDRHSRERLELMEDVRDAIGRGELVVYYQPKVDLPTGRLTGVEALVRWQHPTHGLLYPDQFLDLIEQSGLMGPLAIAVFDAALGQQAAWASQGVSVTMAVNLSARNLRDEDLPEKVAALLAHHHIEPGNLVVEITEDSLMADPEESRRVLERLRDLGLELSIDDYGTGFSSLAYLRHLPVRELKLDRTFLADAAHDPRAVSIIRSTIDLAHALGLRIVAEGVETPDALRLITVLGCDVAQGYLLGRPTVASDVLTRATADDYLAMRMAEADALSA